MESSKIPVTLKVDYSLPPISVENSSEIYLTNVSPSNLDNASIDIAL